MVDLCPTCGAVKASPSLFRGRLQNVILEFIRSHPDCNLREIASHVYADDIDGGADDKTITVHLMRMRAKLELNGLDIITSRGPGATYRLVKIGS